jgi:hypothetical protein
MDRILEHIKSWCMGYILLVLTAVCAIKGEFELVLGGLKAIGWLIGIGLVCGIPLFIFYTIKGKWPRVEKVIHVIIALVITAWLLYGSVLSFIDAKTTKSGAYVTSESGEEWWASKSQLKRIEIVEGSMLFFLGCGAAWYCWQVLKTKKKESHTEDGLCGFEEGLHDEDG